MKFAIIALSVAMLSSSAFAQEVVTEPVTNVSLPTATDTVVVPDDLKAQFEAVCTSKAIKSKKLTSACETHAYPKLNKKGTKFTQAGVGKEMLILSVNIDFLK